MLVLVVVAALTGTATAGTPEEERLEETKARIEAVRDELEEAEEEQHQDAAALDRAEERLAVVTEALVAAEQAVERQRQAVADAAAELERLERLEVRQSKAMSARLAMLYKQGSTVEFAPVLTADDPSEALARTALIDVVVRADQRSFEEVGITQRAVDAQRRQLALERASLERVVDQREEVVALAAEVREERALALAQSAERVEELQAEESHLEAERDELEALARRAARVEAASRAEETAVVAPVSGTADKAVSGGWTWPASGPVTSEFGYRWGRQHEGIDIGAPMGAPIWAAAAGTVSYAGSMSGYGNIILVDHGGGVVTAYAHQSAFAVGVGTRVAAGQQIGYIGSTGRSTGPHLHFEVRVGGAAQNPRSYLP